MMPKSLLPISTSVPLVILGAGAAGLYAAWTAAKYGVANIHVLDRLSQPGIKLAATGGGRGNISHLATETDAISAFGRHGRFILPAFQALPPEQLRQQLAEAGLSTTVDADGRIYPTSQSADTFRNRLVSLCRSTDSITFHTHTRVQSLEWAEVEWRIGTEQGDLQARNVILALGGKSAPKLGSDGTGFVLAERLGYSIASPVPALTPLRLRETWISRHSGLSVCATLSLPDVRGTKNTSTGDILFTHHGISGPAVLNYSGYVARCLQKTSPLRCCLQLWPQAPDWVRLRREQGGHVILSWLNHEGIPRSLAETFLELSKIPIDRTFSRLSSSEMEALSECLTALPLHVTGTGGFENSMVTSGGVALKQIHPETMESRLHPGLFFAGEMMDLDGPTGGWNLHWAFASGHLAGMTCATRMQDLK